MNADVFIDTNVFLYSIDEDPGNAAKRQRAQQLLLSERWGWSVQVAAEFFVNATSVKRPFKLAGAAAAALVETWLAFPTVDITPALFRAAVDIQQRFQLSYWDAAILAAAQQMGCPSVYSEDLNPGQDYDEPS
jgi:predicted nucleic acid-binding protein